MSFSESECVREEVASSLTSIDPSHPVGGDQRIIRATVQRIEDHLRDSQEEIARIVVSAMDAIVAIDDDQRIVVFNPAAEQMFRCAASDAIGTSLERFIPAHYHSAHHEHFFRLRESSLTNLMTGFLSPAWALRADGEEFPIEASIFKSGGDGTRLFVAFVRDITERKRSDNDSARERGTLPVGHAQRGLGCLHP